MKPALTAHEIIKNSESKSTGGKIGMWKYDLTTQNMKWSKELYSMLGLDSSKPPPTESETEELFYPDSWTLLQDAFSSALNEGKSFELELRAKLENGRDCWAIIRGGPRRDKHGNIVKLTGAVCDISSNKKNELRLANLIESSPNGLVLVDIKGEIAFANSDAVELFGYPAHELLGRPLTAIIPEAIKMTHVAGNQTHLEKNPSNRMKKGKQMHALRKDGSKVPVEIKLSPLGNYSEDSLFIASIVDLTERKASEAEKDDLRRQLNFSQKMESIGRLVGGIAHDYNNMLTVILANAELVKMKLGKNSPLWKRVCEIEEAADRSAQLTKRLLTFSRTQPMFREKVDIGKAIQGMSDILSRLIGENIELAYESGRSLGYIYIDPIQIDHIVTNLCVNARDSIGPTEKGKIEISTSNISLVTSKTTPSKNIIPGEYVCLSISDNGCGMDKEIVECVFEPFFTTKAVGDGTGLGLTTVYSMVEQVGGHIEIDSDKGLGTKFSIYWPRHEEEEEEEEVQKLSSGADVRVQATTASIILVEDDLHILEIISEVIRNLGHNVVEVQSSETAVDILRESPDQYDIVISDVVMPGLNGPEVVNEMLAIKPSLDFLLMSGYSENILSKLNVKMTSENFLSKPFRSDELAGKIAKILGKKRSDTDVS